MHNLFYYNAYYHLLFYIFINPLPFYPNSQNGTFKVNFMQIIHLMLSKINIFLIYSILLTFEIFEDLVYKSKA